MIFIRFELACKSLCFLAVVEGRWRGEGGEFVQGKRRTFEGKGGEGEGRRAAGSRQVFGRLVVCKA